MPNVRVSDWRAAIAATALGAAALLGACGGGGDVTPAASPPSEAAASYAQGVISGFGSVIVGGVRYDDAAAAIADEDGTPHNRSELKLGMMVEVDAGVMNRMAASAVAQRIRFGTEILGPVGAIDTAASTVQVLGQTVLVTGSTVFDSTLAGGLAALAGGAVVEVHGIQDTPNQRIVATRIEAKPAAAAYRLRGLVAALDSTAKTFKIGAALISYAGLAAADVPVGLANDQLARVQLQTAQQAGAWVATKLRSGLRRPESHGDAHVEGVITAFTSRASFEVNGLKVDASAASFPDGTAGIVLGARVEVTGAVANGVLVATRVEIEDHRDAGHRMLELHGDISAIDASAKTFALRGVTVWFGGAVEYRKGTAAALANGKTVEVRGVLSADRTRLEARRIEFKV
jgi:hypothetical protein